MENLQKNIARNVKAIRKTRGFTQEKLAGRIGKSVFTISQLERGATTPGIDTLAKIAKALDCTVNDVLADAPMKNTSLDAEKEALISEIWAELMGQRNSVLNASLKAIKAIKDVT